VAIHSVELKSSARVVGFSERLMKTILAHYFQSGTVAEIAIFSRLGAKNTFFQDSHPIEVRFHTVSRWVRWPVEISIYGTTSISMYFTNIRLAVATCLI
jgi:hypothetical protein